MVQGFQHPSNIQTIKQIISNKFNAIMHTDTQILSLESIL